MKALKHVALIILMNFLIATVIYYFSQSMENYEHEMAHLKWCEYYGGNATITYNSFGLSGTTYCTLKGYQKEKHLLDGMNEIVGYVGDAQRSLIIYCFVVFSCLQAMFYTMTSKYYMED